jgi:hypothetical protein
MHQLVVLSLGWAAFFHLVPGPALTNFVPQSSFFFLAADFDSFFWVKFFIFNKGFLLPN